MAKAGYIRWVGCALAGLAVIAAVSGVRADKAARQKARYFYSAGQVEQAVGNEAQAYEYYKKAYMADPSYPEASLAYGSMRLYVPIDTLQSNTELDRSLEMIRTYVDTYPGDTYESQYYGYLSGQLEHVDEAVRVLERAYENNPRTSGILSLLAEVYSRNDRYAEAYDALDRYERQEGMSPQLSTRKISMLLARKDTVGAIREAGRLVASDRNDPRFLILKGNVFEVISQPDSAYACYARAERLDPESTQAKLAIADYFKQKGDSVAYDNKMNEVIDAADFELDDKMDFASDYLQTLIRDGHATERGDQLIAKLLNQYPHEARVLDLSARYSAAKGDFKDAEEKISYAIDRDPVNTTYWGQLMTYQAADRRPEDAIKTYQRAATHFTPDNNLRMYFATVANMARRYDLAIDVYRSMIEEINPGLDIDKTLTLNDVRKDITLDNLSMLSALLASVGDLYHESGDTARAYAMYDNAIALDDHNYMARNNYAYFLSTGGGDLDKALELSSATIQGENADNPTFLDTYAWINYLKGNLDVAEEVQLKAVAAQEGASLQSAELFNHLGDILEKKGDEAGALENWRKAKEVYEKNEETDEPDYPVLLNKIKKAEAHVHTAAPAHNTHNDKQ